MEEGQIRWMAVTAALAAAALVFFLLRYLGKSRQTGEKIRHVYREISGLLREKGTASGYYQRSRQWLVKLAEQPVAQMAAGHIFSLLACKR